MKLLSITVPCYNSAAYMSKCIDTLLFGGEDVEILIVNDGSSDNTLEIANEYARKYPTICRVIDKENGGHGSGVNAGIREAKGLFFKVVDSDDWVDTKAYAKILEKLREYAGGNQVLDLLISNFVYDKVGEAHKKVMRYHHALPIDTLFTWNDVKHFRKGQYILMHSVIYRTKMLRDCGVTLPEHTFYVDNIYVWEPMLAVKNMYYLDVNFYHYYIGREDQSVNEQIMISRIDQQIKVNKIMVDFYNENQAKIASNRHRKQYMYNYLEIITMISTILMVISGTEENLEKRKELWAYIKKSNYLLWRRMRYGFLGNATNLPGSGGRRLSVDAYKVVRKFFKFN